MNNFLPESIESCQVLTTVGLISDTHMPQRWPQMPTAVPQIFSDVDLILHAGDVGELWVLDELSRIAPVIAVQGNDDSRDAEQQLPYQQIVNLNGERLLLWHSHYQNRVDEMHARRGGDLTEGCLRIIARAKTAGARFVHFGHWHLPLIFERDGVVAVNAGAIASGNPFIDQSIKTVALLYLLKDGRFHICHVNLAEPDRPYTDLADFSLDFAANLAKFGRSILSPSLRAANLRSLFLREIYPHPALAAALLTAYLPLAHRVWAGEKNQVEANDIIDGLKSADMPEKSRRHLLALLADHFPL